MEKVIFIGGTARSGSTLLDLIISNDLKAYSVGEVVALFRPTRKHHFKKISYINEQDDIWKDIRKDGESKLYKNIFAAYEDVYFVVDSSKDPFWIKKQNEYCRKHNIDYKNILIFKSPYEFAHSKMKRGENWKASYINYHKRYFKLIDSFYTISYKDLVEDKNTVKYVCEWLNMPYSEEKANYWLSNNNAFFGSRTPKKLQNLVYDSPSNQEFNNIVEYTIKNNP